MSLLDQTGLMCGREDVPKDRAVLFCGWCGPVDRTLGADCQHDPNSARMTRRSPNSDTGLATPLLAIAHGWRRHGAERRHRTWRLDRPPV